MKATIAPTLRNATATDATAVEALLAAAQLPLVGVRDALESFTVAEDGSRIVGVAGIEECGEDTGYALLRSVAVDPEWRGRELGQALVARAIASAQERGIRSLYLLTTTAEAWFPRFGFAITSRDAVPDEVRASAEFCSACPASATVMVLHLETA